MKYLDFTSGIGVTSTGHSHPAVASAISEQAKQFLFAQQNCIPATAAKARAAESLHRVLPRHLEQSLLVNSGSEAVDQAVKIARHATKRPNIIVFDGSFHGRTVAAMSLSTSNSVYSKTMQKMPGTVVAPFPSCLHCPVSVLLSRPKASSGTSVAFFCNIVAFSVQRPAFVKCLCQVFIGLQHHRRAPMITCAWIEPGHQ
jgi:4-aminobutyrate aminotransferase-like enzyme